MNPELIQRCGDELYGAWCERRVLPLWVNRPLCLKPPNDTP